jgi:outer membrane biosynthesis protein TonB
VQKGYNGGSTRLITEFEEIFSNELEKGANALNRNTDLRGVIVPRSEENEFIDGYYEYLKATSPEPPTPPVQPTPPEPAKPIEPTTPKPPKPKVKKAIKPPVTKVEKLSKKYEDFDLDF